MKEGPENNSCWAESLTLIQEIQGMASSLATSNQRIEPADIRSFIHSEDERIVDSEEDITDQIIAHYSLQDDQEGSVEEVAKVSVSEAIAALNTLKLYQEQRDQLANQDLIAQLQKESRILLAEKTNSKKQSNLTGWLG